MNKAKCLEILTNKEISLESEIDFDVNGMVYTLSFVSIIDSFMHASEESQMAFVEALQTASMSKDGGVEKFFEGMGQLLLMTHLSKNIQIP